MGQQEGRDRHQSSTEPHTSDTQRPAKQPKEPILPSQGVQTSNAQAAHTHEGSNSKSNDNVQKMRWLAKIRTIGEPET